MEIHGKTALVTGGTDGIGLCIARLLKEKGASVIVCGRRANLLASAQAEGLEAIEADLSSPAGVTALVDAMKARSLDILVNNAGAGVDFDLAEPIDLDAVDRLTLAGQGNRRLLANAGEAPSVVDRELHSASRVVARAVRLRIRLAPGVRLKKGHFRVDGRVLSPEVKPGPIYVRMCESVTLDEGLAIIAGTIYVAPSSDYGAATFPMVSLDVDVDASKMIGLRNGDWTVDQAFARAKLRLDPKGAHAQAAAAMAATRGIVKTFKIAGPFTIAFVTGDGQVAIAYHVTEEHFSAPA